MLGSGGRRRRQLPSTSFNKRVGANVQEFRKAGLSQAELAHELNLRGFPFHQQGILKVERGSRPLKLEEAHEIADVLGVDAAHLSDSGDERSAALGKLRTAERAIARYARGRDEEQERHAQQMERLNAEIERQERLRRKAADELVAILTAEGRPDLASFYVNLEQAERLIAIWKQTRDGDH